MQKFFALLLAVSIAFAPSCAFAEGPGAGTRAVDQSFGGHVDMQTTPPADGQFVMWNSTTKTWVPGSPTSVPITEANGGTGKDASAAGNGKLLIGNGSGFSLNNLTGTANQLVVTNGSGTITLGLPQSIATTSDVTFGSLLTSKWAVGTYSAAQLQTDANGVISWCSSTTVNGTKDTSLSRISAGLVGVGNGTAADFSGSLKLTNAQIVGVLTLSNPLAATGGGTGFATTTTGDMLVGAAGNNWSKVAAGTATYVWTANGAGVAPSWQAAAGGASINPTTSKITLGTGVGMTPQLVGPSDRTFWISPGSGQSLELQSDQEASFITLQETSGLYAFGLGGMLIDSFDHITIGSNHTGVAINLNADSVKVNGTIRGGSMAPDTIPVTANAFDDQFDGSSVDVAWTALSTPAGLVQTEGDGALCIAFNTPGSTIYALTKDPGSTFDIRTKVSTFVGTATNNYGSGLIVRDSASDRSYWFLIGAESNTPEVFLYRITATFTSPALSSKTAQTLNNGPTMRSAFYLRVVQDGTNISFQYSPGGQFWITLATEGRTSFLTNIADQLGPECWDNSGVAHGTAWDFCKKQ